VSYSRQCRHRAPASCTFGNRGHHDLHVLHGMWFCVLNLFVRSLEGSFAGFSVTALVPCLSIGLAVQLQVAAHTGSGCIDCKCVLLNHRLAAVDGWCTTMEALLLTLAGITCVEYAFVQQLTAGTCWMLCLRWPGVCGVWGYSGVTLRVTPESGVP
jgi:hypothetical protein